MKKNILQFKKIALLALALSSGLVSADQTWKGTTSTLWATTGNWSGNAVPGTGDLAIYSLSSTANLSNYLSASYSIKGILVSNVTTAAGVGGVSLNSTNSGVALTLGAGGIDMTSAATNLTMTLPVVLGANQSWIVTNSKTLTIASGVSGSGTLLKNTPNASSTAFGQLSLNASNTFTGIFTINAGRVVLGNAFALGSSSAAAIVNSGGQIYWTAAYTIAKSFQVSGSGLAGDGTLRESGSVASTINGNITMLADAMPLKMDGGSSFTLNGNITGTNRNLNITLDGSTSSTISGAVNIGTGGFTKASTSTLILNGGSNVWSGGTLISGGGLTIGNGGAGSLGTGTITNNGTLTFNTTSPITINDIVLGTGSLIQNGTGALTLGNVDPYTGNTTIGAGARLNLAAAAAIPNTTTATLTVNGVLDVTGPGSITIGGTQTLTGSGTILGNVNTVSGATLNGNHLIQGNLTLASGANVLPAGANSYGVLTVNGNTTLNGPTINYDLSNVATESPALNDEIYVNGALTLNGTTTIVLNPRAGNLAPGAYILIRYNGVLSGSGNFVLDQPYDGLAVDTSVPGVVRLVVAAGSQLTWVGDGSVNTWDINSTANWNNGAGASVFHQYDSVLFNDNGSASPAVNITTNVKPALIIVGDASANYVFSGNGKISGAASILKTNTSTLTITTISNDYSGPTIVQAGTISMQDNGTFPAAGGIVISNGATYQFAPPSSVNIGSPLASSITGSGTLQIAGSGIVNLGNQGNTIPKINIALAPGALIDVQSGTLRNGGWQGGFWTDGLTWTNMADLQVDGTFDEWDGNTAYVNQLNGGGIVGIGISSAASGTHTMTVGVNNGSGSFYGTVECNISPATNSTLTFNKIGTGTQYIDRFTRGNGGTGTPTLNVNGGILQLGGSSDNVAAAATVNAGGILQLAKSSTAGVHALGGTLTINSNGLCQLTGTGGDQIYYGASVAVNAGGTFDLNGQSEGINGLSGAGVVESTTGYAVLTVGSNNASSTFAGLLTDYSGNALALTKVGTGTQIMTGTNTYTGGTLVGWGTLQYGNAITNSVPSGDIGLVNPTNAATATLSFVVATNTTITYNGNITNGAAGGNLYENGFGGTLILGGTNTFLGNVNINAGALWIHNSYGLGLGVKTVQLTAGTAGQCTLHLDGSGGNIDLGPNISYNTSYVTGTIYNEGGDNTIEGTFNLTSGGGDTSIFANAGSLTLTGSLIPNTTGRNLEIGGAGNGTNTIGGYISDGSGANTLSGLLKMGTGNWTLLGNNTFSGITAVEGGTLVLGATGTLPLTTSINVYSNATLDVSLAAAAAGGVWTNNGKSFLGSGTVNGNVALANNSLLQPGGSGSRGTLTFNNNLTLSLGVTNQFDLGTDLTPGTGSNDLVVVHGNLDPQGSTISINPLQPLSPGTYRLFTYAGSKLSSFNPTPLVSTPSRYILAVDETTPNQINLIVSGTVSSLTWYGSTTNWDINTTANWNLGAQKYDNFDAVTFDDTSVTNLVNIVSPVLPTAVAFNNSATNYTMQGAGKISGPVGISKSGSAVLRINNANDFIGPVNVSGGTLMAGSATAFGATNGVVTVASGATLDVNAQNLGLKPFVVGGTGVGNSGAIINSSTTAQVNALNTVTLTGDTTFGGGGRWDVRANGVPLASLSTGGNAYNLTKISTNQVSLVSVAIDPALANINVVGGLFGFEANSTTMGNPTNILTIWTNAQFQLWGPTNLVNKPMVLNGGTNWCLNNGSGTATVISPITLAASSIIDVSGTSMTLNGPLVETNSLTSITKIGSGLLALGATNTYSGGTIVTAGTLQLGSGGVGGNIGTGALTINSSTLQFNRSDDFTWATDMSTGTNNTLVKLNTDTITIVSTNISSGNDMVNGGTLIVSTNGYLTSGNQFWIAQNATTGACIINGGILISTNWVAVGRNNTNSLGTMIINSGSARKLGPGNIIVGSLGGAGTLTMNGGIFYNDTALYLGETANQGIGLLNLNGGLIQASVLSRAPAAGKTSIARFNGGTLQANTNQASFIVIDQALIQNGGLVLDDGGFVITNNQPLIPDVGSTGGLTKTGAGTLYLNSTNTYTGLTLVNGGKLAGNISVAGALTVGASGTLSPGPATIFPVGTVTAAGAVTLNGTLAVDVSKDIGVGVSDLVVGSTINYGGTLAVNQLGVLAYAAGDSFKLFTAGAYTGSFASIIPASPGTGISWDTSYLTVDGTLRVKAGGFPATPAPITATYTGSNLLLSWPAAYLGLLLQVETNSLSTGLTVNAGDWHTIAGSGASTSISIPVNPANPAVYFRLVKP